jgi:hypothetical protein
MDVIVYLALDVAPAVHDPLYNGHPRELAIKAHFVVV